MRSNRILYILSIGVSLLVFFWMGSFIALSVAIFLLCFSVLLAIGVMITRSITEVDIEAPTSCSVGDEAFITLKLKRGLPFSAALVTLDIACISATFGSEEHNLASVALNTTRSSEVRIPLDVSRYGRTEVRIESGWCTDPLGLFRLDLPWAKRQSCLIYPEALVLATNVKHVPLSRAFGDTYDETRSGSDVDEVFDIREFQAGDHLASVHWKLTSKFDTMMSRQFSHPVDFELIVISLAALEDEGEFDDDRAKPIDIELLNGVAAVGEAVSLDFVQQGLSHNYGLPVKGELVTTTVDGAEAMDVVSELLLDAPISKTYSEAIACLLSSEVSAGFTKCILVTPVYDEHLWTQLSLEMDLSVVLVARGSGVQEIGGSYDLVVVDIDDTEGHERCISL